MKQVKWRRVLLAYAAGLLLCGGFYLSAQAYVTGFERTGAPQRTRLHVQTTRHDFGPVPAGSVLRHVFTLENRGTKRVVLNQDACRCDNALPEGYLVLPPGDQWQLPLTLKTDERRGPLRRVVTIATSDSHRPQIAFTLTAHVVD